MKTIHFLGYNVSVSSTARAFLLRGALVVALSLCSNSAVLAQGTWMPWADTGNLGNSSPTGDQPPRAVGQSDEIFYTNFSGQLQFLQFGGTPRVVASGSYVDPKCWGSGITTCLASATAAPTVTQPIKIPVHPANNTCTTVDCQVQALPWNVPANLYWYGVNYVQPKWQSLGPLATSWYTIVGDSANVLHALAIGAGYALQERSLAPGGSWTAWQNLGGKYRGTPACYQYAKTLQCFAPTYSAQMARIIFDGQAWQPATTLSQALPSTPSIISVQPGTQEMYFVSGGNLMHMRGAGNMWSTPEDLGPDAQGADDVKNDIFGPTVQCVSLRFAVRCYALRRDGHIWQRESILDIGQIAAFTVSPNVITQGETQPATLAWSVANCPVPGCTFTISSAPVGSTNSPTGLLQPSIPSGTTPVNPTVSTKYYLSANDGYQAKTASTTLTVDPPTSPPPTNPGMPPTQGVSQVQFWNCLSNSDTASIYAGASGSSTLTNVANIGNQYNDTSCGPGYSAPGYVLKFPPGIATEYVLTDNALNDACTQDPKPYTLGPCIVVGPWQAFGQSNGVIVQVNASN